MLLLLSYMGISNYFTIDRDYHNLHQLKHLKNYIQLWLIDFCPELFEEYVLTQLKKSIDFGQDGVLFINAWNEWAEGAHLEPDEKYGMAYLEALKRARIEACKYQQKKMR